MIKTGKRVKYWVVTNDGEKKGYYSLGEFKFIPSLNVKCFIVSNTEMNDTIKRNRVELRKMERIYRKRK
jgi:hypothetical protein